MPDVAVTRTYLELNQRAQFHPARLDDPSLRLEQAKKCSTLLYRYLYAAVGQNFSWIDRGMWSDAQLAEHLGRPEVSIWLLYAQEEIAGYFELSREGTGSVEIVYFGLVERFFGRGWGKHLLTCAVEQAWAMGANRVWLHTCTLDHPAALPNYLARGFRPFKTESYTAHLPG